MKIFLKKVLWYVEVSSIHAQIYFSIFFQGQKKIYIFFTIQGKKFFSLFLRDKFILGVHHASYMGLHLTDVSAVKKKEKKEIYISIHSYVTNR